MSAVSTRPTGEVSTGSTDGEVSTGSTNHGRSTTAGAGAVLRFELVKLGSQWRLRVVLLACLVGPAAFVAVVSRQSSLPADTVFGRWMHQTGWAGPLVVLGFACSWVLPLITSLVAGDAFAAEDRLGTWRHLLVAVRSPGRIFVAKVVAGLVVIVLLVAALAVSGVVGGLIGAGSHPLPGLDGHQLTPGTAARTVLVAWLVVLAPTLAFAGVGFLGSVALGRSPMGLLVPAVLALALALVQLLPIPVAVRMALPSQTFLAWRGLFTDPTQTGPLVIGVVVDLVWAAVAVTLAYAVFRRRDFTDLTYEGSARRGLLLGALPLVGLLVVSTLVVTVTTSGDGRGITRPKVEASMTASYGHLYRLQFAELGRPAVTEEQLGTRASCAKGNREEPDAGPGTDWRCVLTWHLPDTGDAVGTAIYQLEITPDGRYVADGDGPKPVNGSFPVRTPNGPGQNPLWQLDGLVDLLSTSTESSTDSSTAHSIAQRG